MSRKMCEMDKAEKVEKQENPAFCCKKCNAVSHKEKHVCKPKKIYKN